MRRILLAAFASSLLVGLASPRDARSAIAIGAKGPNFTKSLLVGTTQGPSVSLYDYADRRVIVLFLLGYS